MENEDDKYRFVYEPIVHDTIDTEYANSVMREVYAKRARMAAVEQSAKGAHDGK